LAKTKDVTVEDSELNSNVDFIKLQLKALMARNLFETSDYFEVLFPMDKEIKTALEVINDTKRFNSLILKKK